MALTPGNWFVNERGEVISDTVPQRFLEASRTYGHDDLAYYGGFLLAESLSNRSDAELFAASKNILLMAAEVIKDVNREDLDSIKNLKAVISKFI